MEIADLNNKEQRERSQKLSIPSLAALPE